MVVLLTEVRDEFKNADPELLGELVRRRQIVDARHALDLRRRSSPNGLSEPWDARSTKSSPACPRPPDRLPSKPHVRPPSQPSRRSRQLRLRTWASACIGNDPKVDLVRLARPLDNVTAMTSARDHIAPAVYLRPVYLGAVWLGVPSARRRDTLSARRPLAYSPPAGHTHDQRLRRVLARCAAGASWPCGSRAGAASVSPTFRRYGFSRRIHHVQRAGHMTSCESGRRVWLLKRSGYALGTVLLGAVASLAGIVAGARLRRAKSR